MAIKLAKHLSNEGWDENFPVEYEFVKSNDEVKFKFTPSEWRQAVELLRSFLYDQGRPIFISFKYKPMGPKGTEIDKCSGYVTRNNIAQLPQFLIRAWSDITVYDLVAQGK